jgi:hypothetical protein
MNLRDFRNWVFPDLNSELISTNGKGIFQSKIPETLDKFEEIEFTTVFLWLVQLDVDFRSRHSLSAGGPRASSACAFGVSLDALFPQESRTFLSNQLCSNI